MQTLVHLGIACCAVGLLFVFSQRSIHADSSPFLHFDSVRTAHQLLHLANHLEFARILDTVYVLGERFVEVDLSKQRAVLRYRNGDTLAIPISSGHITPDGGIPTPTGIFSIQTKTPKAISRQFGNTVMLWWVGFNYNVGFHGLEIHSYYRHLGVRPSSHGCIRVGREAILDLYNRVREGDPVIVHEGNPARILAFSDTLLFDTTHAYPLGSRTKALEKLMTERLYLLYNGERIAYQNFSLYIPRAYQLRPGGYSVGSRDSLVMPQQRSASMSTTAAYARQDYFLMYPAPSNIKATVRSNSILTHDSLSLK
ncbi:MAG: L,D-transpeptidase [Bacteroidota bacterium]|nr:L,D-transpeptidase [Candidatus Kapabacteria bacterium]MDW8219178.1 L,D-transpeptidase [Bacteroidota bacterium]